MAFHFILILPTSYTALPADSYLEEGQKTSPLKEQEEAGPESPENIGLSLIQFLLLHI